MQRKVVPTSADELHLQQSGWGVILPFQSRLYDFRSRTALTMSPGIKYMHHAMALDPVAAWITSQGMATPNAVRAQTSEARSSKLPLTMHIPFAVPFKFQASPADWGR